MYTINRYRENPLGKKTYNTLVLSLLFLSVVPRNDNFLRFGTLLSDPLQHANASTHFYSHYISDRSLVISTPGPSTRAYADGF
jgi:hypothetical protein